MENSLRLQVIFSALDKLTGPIDRMRQGAKGLTAEMSSTRNEIKALAQAQRNIDKFRLEDAGFRKRAQQIEEARAATARYRAEIAATDQPTIKMQKNLDRAEKRESVLIEKHNAQSGALAELSGKLEAAGIDVAKLGDHEEQLAGKMRTATTALDAQKTRAEKMARAQQRGQKASDLGGSMSMAGAAATASVSLPVVAVLKGSVDAAIESRDALGQVQASMAGMGNAAQRTLPQLQAQAKALQHTSTFDDDDILRNVTTSMLTFDKVSGPVFDRAQQATVNLSAKFKKDLQSSSMMVGKALQDPVKGLTALTKVGVSFTAAQKAQITAMAGAGNTAGAQAIILGELERQTKGAALAAREAKPGADVTDSWNDFKETTGEIVLKILPPLTDMLKSVLDAFNNLSPGSQKFIIIVAMIAAALGPLMTVFGGVIMAVGGVAAALSIGLLPAAGVILLVIAAVALLGYAAYQIYQNWEPIKTFFIGLWEQVKAAFAGPMGTILTAIFPFIGIPLMIYRNWDAISAFFSNLWAGITAKFNAGVASVKGLLSGLGDWLKGIGKMMMDGLLLAIDPLALGTKLINMAKNGIAAFKDYLGIKSPSRLMMAMGDHITAGLGIGIDRGGKHPLKAMSRIAAGVGGAAAMSLASPSLAAGGGIAAGGAAGQRGGGASSVTFNVTIQITGSDAADPKASAAAIKRELDQLLKVEARGAYRDG